VSTACIEEESAYRVLVGIHERKRPPGNLGVDEG
jgi:hypothetical protein